MMVETLQQLLPGFLIPYFEMVMQLGQSVFGPYWEGLLTGVWALIKVLLLIAPLMGVIAYATYAERKVLGSMQIRLGPNRVGPLGLFQPLADGLKESFCVIGAALRKKPDTRPILIVVSDGRANVTPRLEEGSALDAALAEAGRIAQDVRVHSFVIDVEQAGLLQFGQARQLAEALRAEYLPVQNLRASTLVGLVREMTA